MRTAATATSSYSPVTRVHAGHRFAVASGLEHISNISQPLPPVGVAADRFVSMSSGPLFMQPPVAAAGISMSGRSVQVLAVDGQLLAPASKKMTMSSDVLQPAAFGAIAPAPTPPRWPVPEWSVATSAQPKAPATHIVPVNAPAISEASGIRPKRSSASHDIEQRAGAPVCPRGQSRQAIKALQEWGRMTPTEREEEGSLYLFLTSRDALLVDTNRHFLAASTVAQLEWAILPDAARLPQCYRAFLERRARVTVHLVNAEGMLTAKGATVLGPMLQEAGLPMPPVAESDAEWRERVRPLIEQWYAEHPLQRRETLYEFIDERSPGRTATQTQELQLIALGFYLTSQDVNRLTDHQRRQYGGCGALASAHGIPEPTLRCYVKDRGLPLGSPLWKLLPESLREQARAVDEREARWQGQVQPLVEQWWASLERKSLKCFVEGSLPETSWIAGQGSRLAALHYYMMEKFRDRIPEGRREFYQSVEAFADAQGMKAGVLRKYVLNGGRLQPKGESLKRLLPLGLSTLADRDAVAGLGPRAEPPAQRSGVPATQVVAASHAELGSLDGATETFAARSQDRSRPHFRQRSPAPVGMSMWRASTQTAAGDGQSLAPASKRMRMAIDVPEPPALHGAVSVSMPPGWPEMPMWNAARHTQPDAPATHIAPASMAAMSGPSGFCQPWPAVATNALHDIEQRSRGASDVEVLSTGTHLLRAQDTLSANVDTMLGPIPVMDRSMDVGAGALDTVPESGADLENESLAELAFDWDEIDMRIAASLLPAQIFGVPAAAIAASDAALGIGSQLSSKSMRMVSDAPEPQWSEMPTGNAARYAQSDTPATHIEHASMAAMSGTSGVCRPWPAAATNASHGIEQRSRRAGAVCPREQSAQAIKALQAWDRMTLSERVEKGPLYKFLESRGALLKAANGRFLPPPTVAQLEWAMLPAAARPLHGYPAFLEDRDGATGHLVNAEGMLSAKGATLLGPILNQAGLLMPPIAESDATWPKRVRPLIERWYVKEPSQREALIEFIKRQSPGRTATQTQKLQLIALGFHLMRRNVNALTPEQRQEYDSRSALARAYGIPEGTLRSYVKDCGGLALGSPLWKLLPESLREQERPVEEEWIRWQQLVGPLVEEWWKSSERKSLKCFVEGLLPKDSWIRGQASRLAALHYHVMERFSDRIAEARRERYQDLEAFADAQRMKTRALRKYVLNGGRLHGRGESLKLLLPPGLAQSPDRPVAAGLGPRAEPAVQWSGVSVAQEIAASDAACGSQLASIPAADRSMGVGAGVLDTVPEPSADLDESRAELDFDWDEIDMRIAASLDRF